MKILSWTDEQVERLKTLWAQGLSASQIAKELSAPSRNAILGKINRLGLSGSRPRISAPRTPRSKRTTPFRPKPDLNRDAGLAPAPTVSRSTSMNGLNLAGAKERNQMPLEDLPPEVAANPVALFDLQDHHCRWPLGDPHHEMLHCGAQVALDRPYCPAHCRMAYQPSPGRQRPPYGASLPRSKQEAA